MISSVKAAETAAGERDTTTALENIIAALKEGEIEGDGKDRLLAAMEKVEDELFEQAYPLDEVFPIERDSP